MLVPKPMILKKRHEAAQRMVSRHILDNFQHYFGIIYSCWSVSYVALYAFNLESSRFY